jgi:hypothetical protein
MVDHYRLQWWTTVHTNVSRLSTSSQSSSTVVQEGVYSQQYITLDRTRQQAWLPCDTTPQVVDGRTPSEPRDWIGSLLYRPMGCDLVEIRLRGDKWQLVLDNRQGFVWVYNSLRDTREFVTWPYQTIDDFRRQSPPVVTNISSLTTETDHVLYRGPWKGLNIYWVDVSPCVYSDRSRGCDWSHAWPRIWSLTTDNQYSESVPWIDLEHSVRYQPGSTMPHTTNAWSVTDVIFSPLFCDTGPLFDPVSSRVDFWFLFSVYTCLWWLVTWISVSKTSPGSSLMSVLTPAFVWSQHMASIWLLNPYTSDTIPYQKYIVLVVSVWPLWLVVLGRSFYVSRTTSNHRGLSVDDLAQVDHVGVLCTQTQQRQLRGAVYRLMLVSIGLILLS